MSTPLLATELLAALAPVLARIGARWYLFGAQAVLVWGRPRFTGDVDVTVEIRDDQVKPFIVAMSAAGFDLRLPGGVDAFVARTRVLPFLYTPTRIPLDVVVAGPGPEKEFLERARRVDLGAVEVPVLSPEDLVITKVLAARPRTSTTSKESCVNAAPTSTWAGSVTCSGSSSRRSDRAISCQPSSEP